MSSNVYQSDIDTNLNKATATATHRHRQTETNTHSLTHTLSHSHIHRVYCLTLLYPMSTIIVNFQSVSKNQCILLMLLSHAIKACFVNSKWAQITSVHKEVDALSIQLELVWCKLKQLCCNLCMTHQPKSDPMSSFSCHVLGWTISISVQHSFKNWIFGLRKQSWLA